MKMTTLIVASVALLVVLSAAAGIAAQPSGVSEQQVAALASAAAQEGLESQAAILADGKVTVSEYGQAVRATVSCLEAAGYDARADEVSGEAGFVITVLNPGDPQAVTAEDAMAPMDAAYDTCDQQYKRLVESVYRATGR